MFHGENNGFRDSSVPHCWKFPRNLSREESRFEIESEILDFAITLARFFPVEGQSPLLDNWRMFLLRIENNRFLLQSKWIRLQLLFINEMIYCDGPVSLSAREKEVGIFLKCNRIWCSFYVNWKVDQNETASRRDSANKFTWRSVWMHSVELQICLKRQHFALFAMRASVFFSLNLIFICDIILFFLLYSVNGWVKLE